MKLEFDPVAHAYTLGGVRVPSVTQIIRAASLAGDGSGFVPAQKYFDRGSLIHSLAEDLDNGWKTLEEIDDYHPEVAPYCHAWVRYMRETGGTVIEVEMMVASPALRFAGTIDRIIERNGKLFLVDLKTTSVPAWAAIQTAGYLLALEEWTGMKVEGREAVAVMKDGAYKVTAHNNHGADRSVFLSALKIARWKEENA